jgi:hypothetical protein
LTVCDTLKACYLINIQTRKETELKSRNKLELDPLNTQGYSIRCDGNGDNELHFIKFFYDGMVQDEFGLPRYMSGDSDNGAFINKAEYISTCGLKTVKIEGHVWDRTCFENEFVIDVSNANGKPCDVKPPVAAPVKPSTSAPAKPETRAPVPAPVSKPVAPPVKPDPVPTPDRAPISQPVRAPVSQPVAIPVSQPVRAPFPQPVTMPVSQPVRAPVPQPVAKPVAAPVTPSCPSPKVWINGCCKDPSSACLYPKQWIDGACKDTCTNSYVCPANSYRIAHRLCYDDFDDCQCKHGYYKSKSEAKCIRHSWCTW